MENLKQFSKRLIKEESAQGATEYILLLVAVVAVVTMFRGQIESRITALLQSLGDNIGAISQ